MAAETPRAGCGGRLREANTTQANHRTSAKKKTPETAKAVQKSKKEEDRQLSDELEMSFPASDPPAST